jgi:mono/diheme cytochrome c family protein
MSATRDWLWTLQLGLLGAVAACGGGKQAGGADTTGMSSGSPAGEAAPPAAAVDTAMAPASGPAGPAAGDSAAGAAAGPTGKVRSADTVAKVVTPKPAAAPKPSAEAPKAAPEAPKPAAAAAPPAAGGPQSPQQVALGDSIFHGQVAGGTCTACHGQDAKGTAVAPNLTDSEWLNGDGSYDFIVRTITTGVPQPKQHPAPMPPKGGASLSDEQVKAAAAYVYSLSH